MNEMKLGLPTPDPVFQREWRWPWAKFELPPDALFTTLHRRFNTTSFALQDRKAFLHDVRDVASRSDNIDEFYSGLAERREQRAKELHDAWVTTANYVIMCPSALRCQCQDHGLQGGNRPHHWGNFMNLVQIMSFDCLIRYFDAYIRHEREADDRKHEKIMEIRKSWKKKRSKRNGTKARNGDAQTRQFDTLSLESVARSPPETVESTTETGGQPTPHATPTTSVGESMQPQSTKRGQPEEQSSLDELASSRSKKRPRLSQNKRSEDDQSMQKPEKTMTHPDIPKSSKSSESTSDDPLKVRHGTEPLLPPSSTTAAEIEFGEQSSLEPPKVLTGASDSQDASGTK